MIILRKRLGENKEVQRKEITGRDNLKEKDKMKKAKERAEMSAEEKKVLLEKRRASYARKVAE